MWFAVSALVSQDDGPRKARGETGKADSLPSPFRGGAGGGVGLPASTLASSAAQRKARYDPRIRWMRS